MDAILESVKDLGGVLIQHQVAHYTIAFFIAWKLVKRDMAAQFTRLEVAINQVSAAMADVSKDLVKHSTRLDTLEGIVIELKNSFLKIKGGE